VGSVPFRADEIIIGLLAEMGHRRDADASARLLFDGSSLVIRCRVFRFHNVASPAGSRLTNMQLPGQDIHA
jgi:hypothetical protein